MNVLVIEDHPTDRKLMSVVLKMEGHVVHESASAESAIDAILTTTPDVILLDLRLPGMDGMALVRQLKANPETSGIPIVVVTAFPESYPREDLLAAGCDAYIAKPINTRQLPNQLREVTERRSG